MFNEPFEILHSDFNNYFDKFLSKTLARINNPEVDNADSYSSLGMGLLAYLKLAVVSGSGQFFVRFYLIIW